MAEIDTLLAHLSPSFTSQTENIAVEALGYVLNKYAGSLEGLDDVVRSGVRNMKPVVQVRTQASAQDGTCPSRIRCQAATGSWTKSRQWETQRTLFSSARATMCPPTKVDGVWPFNDAWLRTSL